MSKQQDFINLIAPPAQELQAKYGLFASVAIAQACLETGYSANQPVDVNTGQPSYNLFGVKGEGPAGSVYVQTWEYDQSNRIMAYFRAYHNYLESLEDHHQLLLTEKLCDGTRRYQRVLDAAAPEEACDMLYACGYMTDGDAPAKLKWIIHHFDLKQYDEEDDPLAKLTDEQLEKIQEHPVPDWAMEAVQKASKLIQANGHPMFGGMKLPVFYEMLVSFDRMGILDYLLKQKGLN